jgi:hypothetical protein
MADMNALTEIAEANGLAVVTDAAQQQDVPLRYGPVGTPLHLRSVFQTSDDIAYWAHRIQSHTSHLPGACPVAEQRCAHEELWALSALDMDGIRGEQAYELGRRLMMCCTTGSNSTICRVDLTKSSILFLPVPQAPEYQSVP